MSLKAILIEPRELQRKRIININFELSINCLGVATSRQSCRMSLLPNILLLNPKKRNLDSDSNQDVLANFDSGFELDLCIIR